MIDPNIDGVVPNERLHDMRRDLRSPVGGGLSGTGPRGEGVFLVNEESISGSGPYTAPKSAFINPTGKASYGVRVGDVVIFGDTDQQSGKGQLCTGVVTAITDGTVSFTKHAGITTEGFSPTISVSDIEGGHRVTITNDNDAISTFDVLDGDKGDKGDPFEFADFTEQQLTDLRSEVASVYYRKREASVITTSDSTSRIAIPFNSYVPTDILFVDVEGLALTENRDYVIDGDKIVLTSPIIHAMTTVNFKCMTVVTMTAEDLDSIVAGAIVDDVSDIVINRFDDIAIATHTRNGLMSSSDKIKLDGIDTISDSEIDRITGPADVSQRFVPLTDDEIDTITG